MNNIYIWFPCHNLLPFHSELTISSASGFIRHVLVSNLPYSTIYSSQGSQKFPCHTLGEFLSCGEVSSIKNSYWKNVERNSGPPQSHRRSVFFAPKFYKQDTLPEKVKGDMCLQGNTGSLRHVLADMGILRSRTRVGSVPLRLSRAFAEAFSLNLC